MSEEFDNEDFTVEEEKSGTPAEGEPAVTVVLASKPISVRYYPNMTIRKALDQVKGKADESAKFRLLLDGDLSSMDTIVPNENAEIIFVGQWINGHKKKV